MGVMAVFPLCLLLSSLDVAQSIGSHGVSLTAPNGQHPRSLWGWCKVARCQNIGRQRWVVIQSRQNGKVSFEQSWDRYRLGFGNPTAALDAWDADHWLGLDAIHYLCPAWRPCELRVELTYYGRPRQLRINPTPDGRYVEHYRRFSVAGAADNYRLNVSNIDVGSTAGDGLMWWDSHTTVNVDGAEFSTKDADHDGWTFGSCSPKYGGQGWWFKSCSVSGLNGRWGAGDFQGLYWYPLTGGDSAASSRMLVRTGLPWRRPGPPLPK